MNIRALREAAMGRQPPTPCNRPKIKPINPKFDPTKKAAVFLKNPPPFLENLPYFLENLPFSQNYCCKPCIVRSFFCASALFM